MEDRELVSRLRRHEAGAEDLTTNRLRELLECIAAEMAPPESRDDLTASALYEILQAEDRVLAGWDESVPFLPYLSVVAARVCLDENRRWSRIREHAPEGDADAPREHPTDLMLAAYVADQADERIAGEVLGHLDLCARCGRIARVAHTAIGAPPHR
jgi:hypothetical protein